jgi:hypothetical protein
MIAANKICSRLVLPQQQDHGLPISSRQVTVRCDFGIMACGGLGGFTLVSRGTRTEA